MGSQYYSVKAYAKLENYFKNRLLKINIRDTTLVWHQILKLVYLVLKNSIKFISVNPARTSFMQKKKKIYI